MKPKNILILSGIAFLAFLILGGIWAAKISKNLPTQEKSESSQTPAGPAIEQPKSLSEVKSIEAQNGIVNIDASEISDTAQFYTFISNGTDIKFFVLKSSDGKIRAAFDACQVCYSRKLGYSQEGDQMICKNCGNIFLAVKISEEKGGCNPVPISNDLAVTNDKIALNVADIETGLSLFE